MYCIESIDYGVVLEGEIVLLFDDSEVVLNFGDLVVQWGIIYVWMNCMNQIMCMLFILIDGVFDLDLKVVIDDYDVWIKVVVYV